MGTIKQGILGGFSGKVGSVIGGVWKGISYMRGIALSYTDAKSDAQLAHRQKFAVVGHFLQPLSEFLQESFRNYAVRMTGINAAFKYNFANAVTGTYPNQAIDYPNARVAQGNLPAPLNAVASSTVAGTVKFDWDDNSGELGADAADETMIVIYNPVQNQAVNISGLAERADGTQTVTVPASFSGDLVQCYLAFKQNPDNGTEISNSAFAGAVTVA